MIEKSKLGLAAAIIVLVFSLWLTWSVRILGSMSQLLQGIAVSLIVMALLEEKTTEPAALFVKGFLISCVLTSIIWFVPLGIMVIYFSSYFSLWLLIYSLVYVVLPRALLPVAIAVTVYGITKAKLKPWEILLSTWYISIFLVFAAYEVWWILLVQPYVQNFYSSGAGAMARDMLLVFLAFLIACALSIIYLVIKEPNSASTQPATEP